MFVLVVRNNSNSQAQEASLVLGAYLGMQGIEHALVQSCDLTGPAEVGEVRRVIERGVDLVVVLGGDGTILRTARQVGTLGVPILGINFGRLGFLANASDDGVVAIVAAALAGDVVQERRANLRIDVVCEGERDPWGDEEDASGEQPDGVRTFFALNELAVTRGANGRLIDFSLGVSGDRVADMRGDGVVVATATGSTGYALSAGGPLVSPGYDGLVVVPIAPHTLHSRSIVTGENDVVEVALAASPEGSYPREASLFVDGELIEFPMPVRHVYVRRGERPTILLRYQREGFYEHIAKTFF
ncbi:MAG TPA: NAD(+)/NADH kinase [Candidatus Aphodovivens excrementavium]|nr:NAD(+)/NADH kinase [Candidatus Aphodovivens excrementavium]